MIKIEAKHHRKILTKKEFAAFMSVSTRTVENWQKKGMPSIQVDSVVRFDPAQCLRWMDNYKKE